MPIRLEFKTNPPGLIFWGEGEVSGPDIVSALREVYQDDRYESLLYWIGDHSLCGKFSPNIDSIRQVVDINRQAAIRNPNLFIALVAPRDDIFGACRQLQPFNERAGFTTSVFRSREEARVWLEDQLGPINDQ